MGFGEDKRPTGPRPGSHGATPTPDDTVPMYGQFYVRDATVFKAPKARKREGGGQIIAIGFPVCRVTEYVSPIDVANVLAQGEAAETLIEFAKASEIVDRYGPRLDAAREIGDKAVDAYHAGGSQGLTDYVRTLRGIGLAIARGEPVPEQAAGLSQSLGQAVGAEGDDAAGEPQGGA